MLILLSCLITVFGSTLAQAAGSSIDLTAPQNGFFIEPDSARIFTSGRVPLHFSDANSPEVSVDDGSYSKADREGITLKAEGLHTLRVRSTDSRGGWSPIQDYRIFVDRTPPRVEGLWRGLTSTHGNRVLASPQAQFTLTATDSLSGVKRILVERKTGVIEAYTKPLTFTQGNEGTLRYAAEDRVGNRSEWTEVSFALDTAAPETRLLVEGDRVRTDNGVYVQAGVPLRFEADDGQGSGVQLIEVQVNDGPVTRFENPIPVNASRTAVKYRAVDKVGNSEGWKSVLLLQDAAPPKLTAERVGSWFAVGGKLFVRPGFSFVLASADTESGLQDFSVMKDGQNFEHFGAIPETKITFDLAGTFVFSARAVDRVGNRAEVAPITVVVDSTAPKTVLRPTQPLQETEGRLLTPVPNLIELIATDSEAGVAQTELSYDGKTFKPYRTPIDPSRWTALERTLWFRSVDRLKNSETTQQVVIRINSKRNTGVLAVERSDAREVPLSRLSENSASTPGARP